MINAERMELGILALESGEYKKGEKYLHVLDGEGGHRHCCLGVLTLEAIRHGLEISREVIPACLDDPAREVFAGKDYEETLCGQVMDWYGLEEADPSLVTASGACRHATVWNDTGPSPSPESGPEEDFTEIAKGFRRAFLGEK